MRVRPLMFSRVRLGHPRSNAFRALVPTCSQPRKFSDVNERHRRAKVFRVRLVTAVSQDVKSTCLRSGHLENKCSKPFELTPLQQHKFIFCDKWIGAWIYDETAGRLE